MSHPHEGTIDERIKRSLKQFILGKEPSADNRTINKWTTEIHRMFLAYLGISIHSGLNDNEKAYINHHIQSNNKDHLINFLKAKSVPKEDILNLFNKFLKDFDAGTLS